MSHYVYILSSKSGVLYIGATSDLERRVFEHKQGLIEGFTKKYRVKRLVYVEQFDRPAEMVARGRQLKGWSRSSKLALIHSQNPEMVDYARRTARSLAPAACARDDPREQTPMTPVLSSFDPARVLRVYQIRHTRMTCFWTQSING